MSLGMVSANEGKYFLRNNVLCRVFLVGIFKDKHEQNTGLDQMIYFWAVEIKLSWKSV